MYTKRRKDSKGSAITEFGPALFVFLIMIFFPLMDVIGIGAVYCCGWYCNFMVTRELAVRRQSDAGAVATEVNTQFMNSGLANFVGIRTVADLVHTPVYNPANTVTGQPAEVVCTSRVTAQPFLTIPFLPSIPGLSAPMTFTMTQARPREVLN